MGDGTVTPIDYGSLGVRVGHVARQFGWVYWEDVAKFRRSDFLPVKNCGTKTINEIVWELDRRGLNLTPDDEVPSKPWPTSEERRQSAINGWVKYLRRIGWTCTPPDETP